MPPTLSVCLVTRNEEPSLPRVLGSVAGMADDVFVVDTGSTDRTVAVATELGARVATFAWDDDFSAARNHALDQAHGDWVLWLNPDEELLPEGRSALKACLTDEQALAYRAQVQEIPRADRLDVFTVTEQTRLFRHDRHIRYIGRLHPRFRIGLADLAADLGKHVKPADFAIRHHAYLSAVTEPKLRWAARLLERELADRPGQLHYLIEYGQTLLRLKDPKGHEVLGEAANGLAPSLGDPEAPSATVGVLLEYLLTAAPASSPCRLSRDDVLLLADRWFPRTPPVQWALAQHWFRQGNFRRAAERLEFLLSLGKVGDYDKTAAFDPNILGERALGSLKACYQALEGA